MHTQGCVPACCCSLQPKTAAEVVFQQGATWTRGVKHSTESLTEIKGIFDCKPNQENSITWSMISIKLCKQQKHTTCHKLFLSVVVPSEMYCCWVKFFKWSDLLCNDHRINKTTDTLIAEWSADWCCRTPASLHTSSQIPNVKMCVWRT